MFVAITSQDPMVTRIFVAEFRKLNINDLRFKVRKGIDQFEKQALTNTQDYLQLGH
ncbi:hypothetical protein GARC_4474 [Paraglaciecola arctica BSs20135]|uniref:Uncharacterized protein n=1 Tax=Paraglaciecola arctica BSs20135 TaxID=493475 RepID=K6YBU9_9ALTE|nr:hypothetical protein GARC_4474 [Paraglaciecola arctica BSs20135]